MLTCCLVLETIIEATNLSHIWVMEREFFFLKPASSCRYMNLGHNGNDRPNRLHPFVSDRTEHFRCHIEHAQPTKKTTHEMTHIDDMTSHVGLFFLSNQRLETAFDDQDGLTGARLYYTCSSNSSSAFWNEATQRQGSACPQCMSCSYLHALRKHRQSYDPLWPIILASSGRRKIRLYIFV